MQDIKTVQPDALHRGHIGLQNWRDFPNTRWAFQHVRELVPTATIKAGGPVPALPSSVRTNTSSAVNQAIDSSAVASPGGMLDNCQFKDAEGHQHPLHSWLKKFEADALLVLHRGEIACEWYAAHYNRHAPHLVFSISKSITSLLAGILIEEGMLQRDRSPRDYLGELDDFWPAGFSAESWAYGDCTIQHLLDMSVSHQFEESYLDKTGLFNEYRMAMLWAPSEPADPKRTMKRFLCSLVRGSEEHGERFTYRSPNTDLLGWIIESVTGKPLAQLFSERLWQPMQAEADADITLDAIGTARAAGGISLLATDLARIAELFRNRGRVGTQQVVPAAWIDDCSHGGNKLAWQHGDFSELLDNGSYRNQWYQTGYDSQAVFGIGIHGQYIYIDPAHEVSIVQFSSHKDPLDLPRDQANLEFFREVVKRVSGPS